MAPTANSTVSSDDVEKKDPGNAPLADGLIASNSLPTATWEAHGAQCTSLKARMGPSCPWALVQRMGGKRQQRWERPRREASSFVDQSRRHTEGPRRALLKAEWLLVRARKSPPRFFFPVL